MAANNEAMVAVNDNDDDDDNGYNDDENILIPWNNPIIEKLELKWGEYYVIDVQDGEYTDDDESQSADDISEAEEEEESNIVRMDTGNNTEVMHAIPLLSYNNGSSIQATAKDEKSSFICLSEVLLQNIFEYASCYPFDILPIEKTCKKFHKVLRADGNFWDHHLLFRKKASEQIKDASSTREKVFCIEGLRMIRESQEKDNVHCLLEFLRIDSLVDIINRSSFQWTKDFGGNDLAIILNSVHTDDEEFEIAGEIFKQVATKVMSKMMSKHQQGMANFSIRLRGDTIGYLIELLQGYMVSKLENALLMAIHREDGSYPMVTKDDILVLDKFTSSHNSASIVWCWSDDSCLSEDVLPSEIRRKIIRMIAYQAGIVKMTGEAFAVAEAKLFHTMGVLLVNAYESTMNYNYNPTSSYQIIHPSTDNVNVNVSDVAIDDSEDETNQWWLSTTTAAAADAEQERIGNISALDFVNGVVEVLKLRHQRSLAAATDDDTAEQKRIDATQQSNFNYPAILFSIPPPPVYSLECDDKTINEYKYIIYTVVPGQIKEAARQNNITPNIVYGMDWLASPGYTHEEEMEIELYYDWDKRKDYSDTEETSPKHQNGQYCDDDRDGDGDGDVNEGNDSDNENFEVIWAPHYWDIDLDTADDIIMND